MISRLLAFMLLFAVGCRSANSNSGHSQSSCQLDLRPLGATLTQLELAADWAHLTAATIKNSPWVKAPDRAVDISPNVLSTARVIEANGCVCCESARFVNGRLQELAFAYVLPSKSSADEAIRLLLSPLLTHQEAQEIFSQSAAGANISKAIRRPLPHTDSLGQRQLLIDVNIQHYTEEDRVGFSLTIFFAGNYAF
jgi:hypothetical protein